MNTSTSPHVPWPSRLLRATRSKAGEYRRAARIAAEVARRHDTAAERARPDFVIIGAQKAGTTSLFNYLAQHPLVQRALRKEVHYFDNHYANGEHWYRSHFPIEAELRAAGALTGEATPYYMAHPHALQRIRSDLPDAKLIAVLRDPVERAVSHYFHEIRHGNEHLSLTAALETEDDRISPELLRMTENPDYKSATHQRFTYLARSRYIEQLRPLLKEGATHELLILRAEDLFADPVATMQKAFEFLGLGSNGVDLRFPVLNKGRRAPISADEKALLDEKLRDATAEFTKATGISWDD
ncbi:MAG: sulfotransferase family protein [Alphaproteobacteria bacterium]